MAASRSLACDACLIKRSIFDGRVARSTIARILLFTEGGMTPARLERPGNFFARFRKLFTDIEEVDPSSAQQIFHSLETAVDLTFPFQNLIWKVEI